MEEAITELKQITGSISSNTLTGTRDVMYRIKLNSEVVKCIGGFECMVQKTDTGFIISENWVDIDSIQKRSPKITKIFALNIPKRLVDPWNELGYYRLEFDYENNCVELIKLC